MPRRSVRVALSTLIGAGLAASCQFSPAAPAIDGGGGRIDATVPGGDGSGPDGAGEVGACLAVDPAGLIECFEFDDDLGDGLAASGLAGARDADLTGGLPAARPGSPAVTIGPGGSLRAPARPAQDVSGGYTLAVWVRPDQIPVPGQVQGVLDHELQYALLLGNRGGPPPPPGGDPGFEARCVHTDAASPRGYEYTTAAPVGAWSLLRAPGTAPACAPCAGARPTTTSTSAPTPSAPRPRRGPTGWPWATSATAARPAPGWSAPSTPSTCGAGLCRPTPCAPSSASRPGVCRVTAATDSYLPRCSYTPSQSGAGGSSHKARARSAMTLAVPSPRAASASQAVAAARKSRAA